MKFTAFCSSILAAIQLADQVNAVSIESMDTFA